jgi:hypothetical protein
MKPHLQNGETHPALSALIPIAALLTAGVIAKLGIIAELVHVAH